MARKSPVKAVLFDIDGVLIDVRKSYLETIRKTIALYLKTKLGVKGNGTPISMDDVHAFKLLGGFNNDWDAVYGILIYFLSLIKKGGKPATHYSMSTLRQLARFTALAKKLPSPCGVKGIQKLLPPIARPDYDLALHMFQAIYLGNELYRQRYGKPSPLNYPKGLIDKETLLIPKTLLVDLKRTAKLGIVTGRTRFEAEYTLKLFKIWPLFDATITHDEVERAEKRSGKLLRKPHPYPLLRCAKSLGSKAQFMYVGDLPDDIRTANQAKPSVKVSSCVFVYRAELSKQAWREIKQAKPDHVLKKPADIKTVYNSL